MIEAHPSHTNGAAAVRSHTSGVKRGQMLVQRTLLQLAQRLVEQRGQIPFRPQVRTCVHRRTIAVGVERYPSSRRLRTISRVMLETFQPRLLATGLTDSPAPSIRWISQRSS